MGLNIFDLNDGLLRKKGFLDYESFLLPFKSLVPKSVFATGLNL